LPSSPAATARSASFPASRSPRWEFWKRACCPSLISDSETVYTPIVGNIPASDLLPFLFDDTDAIHAPIVIAPPQSLLPALVSDADAFTNTGIFGDVPGHATRHVRPPLISDTPDTIYASKIGASLKPALVPSDDTVHATASVTAAKRPALVPSDDVVPSFVTTMFVQPGLLSDANAVPAADVGWHLFVDEPVADADEGYGAHAEAWAYIVPEVYGDEESTETYPFRVQALTGGIPVPARPRLTGSFPRRVLLRGSARSSVRLTGSLTNMKRRRR
jgi:hypothetical protein